MLYLILFALFFYVKAYDFSVVAGDRFFIYNPSFTDSQWYINDHTIIYGPGNTWNLFGITHTDPADPLCEVNFAHAISTNLTDINKWKRLPFSLASKLPETHLWAPHVIYHDNFFRMIYCGGGMDRTKYYINTASSTNLFQWSRTGTAFQAGIDGRDPMILNLGNGQWRLYYTGTIPDLLQDNVTHVTLTRLSSDLINWSEPTVAFEGGVTGSSAGGPTESPFVVRRAWTHYEDTHVYFSKDPSQFGSVPKGSAVQVGKILSHAPEVVRDVDGTWYVSSCGWGKKGVTLARLTFNDGCDECNTSLPIPKSIPGFEPRFLTNLKSPWYAFNGDWIESPEGLRGGYPLNNAWHISSSSYSIPFKCDMDLNLITKDGNPTGSHTNLTRAGSAASISFLVQNVSRPDQSSLAVNINTEKDGGIKLMSFPYKEIQSYRVEINQEINYHLQIIVEKDNINVYYGKEYEQPYNIMDVKYDFEYFTGYTGVGVWQSSALFQNLMCINLE